MSWRFDPRQPVGAATIQFLLPVLALVGVAAMIAGPAYWINGLTQPDVRVHAPLARPATPAPVGELREGVILDLPTGTPARLTVWEPSRSTKLLWRAGTAVNGLAIGVGCLALYGIVSDVVRGRPFSRRNTRRFVAIAALIGVVGLLSQILDGAATNAAIASAGLAGSDGPFGAAPDLDLFPVGLALLVLVLAEAFRVGSRISEDVEGLV